MSLQRCIRSTQLQKLMTAYCDRQSMELNSIAFLFDGAHGFPVASDETVTQLPERIRVFIHRQKCHFMRFLGVGLLLSLWMNSFMHGVLSLWLQLKVRQLTLCLQRTKWRLKLNQRVNISGESKKTWRSHWHLPFDACWLLYMYPDTVAYLLHIWMILNPQHKDGLSTC